MAAGVISYCDLIFSSLVLFLLIFKVNRLQVILNKVLLVGTKTSTYIGKPIVPNAAVHAVVEEQV